MDREGKIIRPGEGFWTPDASRMYRQVQAGLQVIDMKNRMFFSPYLFPHVDCEQLPMVHVELNVLDYMNAYSSGKRNGLVLDFVTLANGCWGAFGFYKSVVDSQRCLNDASLIGYRNILNVMSREVPLCQEEWFRELLQQDRGDEFWIRERYRYVESTTRKLLDSISTSGI